MSNVYVILGNRILNESVEQGTDQEGYVQLIVKEGTLDNTYQGFLGECSETLSRAALTVQQRPTYHAVHEAATNEDATVRHRVLLYDRRTNAGEVFCLDDRVEDTAGEFLYTAQHDIGDQRVELKTLEMYVLADETGG